MKHLKQKFETDQKVQFTHTHLTKRVFWTVVVPEPDEVGQIVIHNPRTNEYHLAYQSSMKPL